MQGFGPDRVVCIDAQSAVDTAGKPNKASGKTLQTYVLQGNGTTSGGTVIFEEASWANDGQVYSGTWSSIITVNASDVSGGKQKFIHISATAGANTRPRIATGITGGGTVSVFLHEVGN